MKPSNIIEQSTLIAVAQNKGKQEIWSAVKALYVDLTETNCKIFCKQVTVITGNKKKRMIKTLLEDAMKDHKYLRGIKWKDQKNSRRDTNGFWSPGSDKISCNFLTMFPQYLKTYTGLPPDNEFYK